LDADYPPRWVKIARRSTDDSLKDFEDETSLSPYKETEGIICHEQINKWLNYLTANEKKVIMLRFGLEDGEAQTLEKIGGEVGLTRDRIRQIEVSALNKLRFIIKRKKLYFDGTCGLCCRVPFIKVHDLVVSNQVHKQPPPKELLEQPPPGGVPEQPRPEEVFEQPPSEEAYEQPPAEEVHEQSPAKEGYEHIQSSHDSIPLGRVMVSKVTIKIRGRKGKNEFRQCKDGWKLAA